MYILLEIPMLCYVLAIALQMSGAIILIIYYCGKTQDRILKEYFPGSNIIERDKNNKVTLEKKKVRKCAVKVYLNRLAFFYIAAGYLFGIYGNVGPYGVNTIALIVIVITFVLVSIGHIALIILSKIIYKEDLEINFDEISDLADTPLTDEEVDEICKMD